MSENRYLAACAAIPRGETRTFAQLASLAGKPGAARAAGRAVAECPPNGDVAWHRVVAADGALARDPARAALQLARLRDDDARPREGEANVDFARRIGGVLFGDLRARRLIAVDEARFATVAPHALEHFARTADALERGLSARGEARATATPKTSHAPSDPALVSASASFDAREQAGAPCSPPACTIDWPRVRLELAERGYSVIENALDAHSSEQLVGRFGDDAAFERTIEMAPRGYGVGRYRYLREPLPEPANALRAAIYTELHEMAAAVPGTRAFPGTLDAFWDECREAGQQRASSIVLRYTLGGVNHPHRDIYGKRWFPYQAVCVLSRRELDFSGGEFVFLRERPDGTEHEDVLPLDRGDVCVFASHGVSEARGGRACWIRVRHGMRVVTSGERYALGLVLHLAE
ncbi:MAG: 2OG-Fe(II) oxygenase [Planctomycetota bacterium]